MKPPAGAARWSGVLGLLLCLAARPGPAHRLEGEVSLAVRDPAGLPLAARVKLSGRLSPFLAESDTDEDGRWRARHLRFGPYLLQVTRQGFAGFSEPIAIRSEIPVVREITLPLEALETIIQVQDAVSPLDPRQTGTVFQLEGEKLADTSFSTPGRGTAGLVNNLPGWLMEANAVLHPRGSEYDTQYVIDGIPMTDNRSPAFAPAVETDELEAIHVFTANIPAEYGRKLGGVVELFTRRSDARGHHPEVALRGGSFSSAESYVADAFVAGRTAVSGGLRAAETDRFLDPPALENYTNHAGLAGGSFRFERDFSARDRLQALFSWNRAHFLAPNDPAQEENGQRQDRRNEETAGRASFRHVFHSTAMATIRFMARDLSAQLWSNPLAAPVYAAQDRGFREVYLAGHVAVQKGAHVAKFGGDGQTAGLHERFYFQQNGSEGFRFQDRQRSREAGAFVQDHWQHGRWTLDAGLRWDYYGLLVQESAWSPRLGAAYFWKTPGVVLHASYDRAFQTPAIENLLLTGAFQGLPVRPSHGDFYEVGVRKGFGRLLRVEANQFWRRFREFADDDVFLNTGINFPIAFSRAAIQGTELRVEMPGRRGFSGFASWSNQIGTGYLPLTGGLFLDKESAELAGGTGRFPITQDQRNTGRAQIRYQPRSRVWLAWGAQYSSGLPVELEPGATREDFEASSSPPILDRVNFARGRVRPGFSWDVSTGAQLWKRESRSVRLQIDVLNAGDRLNLLNFSGLFSGTALAAPRTVGAQLRMQF
ncbi:MAG: TonB-dependent receptor [Acidobacteria bacterium]|nr:TonB-dependent receptor [Acidobacteriota bacterium]